MVHDLLKNCGESLDKVDVIAVAAGPGSFTGLRIGVATAKGLAWGEDKDCAPCSTLESMAWPMAHMEGELIVCAMDTESHPCHMPFSFTFKEGELREYYKDWEFIKYNEDLGRLHKVDENGNRIQLQFATMLAKKK